MTFPKNTRLIMAICCLVMLVPVLGLLASGIPFSNVGTYVSAAVPMGLCFAGHFMLHRIFQKKTGDCDIPATPRLLPSPPQPRLSPTPQKSDS